ncbi:MAG: TlpA family protein disulfide reductase [Planctomycetota bacterium]|jgi:thiol-disulfide isomerase/thioredoxin
MRSITTCVLRLLALTVVLGPVATAGAGEFPDSWYFYNGGASGNVKAKRVRGLEGKPAPALSVENWTGGDATKIADLKGKVVVVDFWGTWCPPCMRAVPKNIKLVEKFKAKGLEFIGVHSTNRANTMAEGHARTGMNYRVAADIGRKTATAYKVGWWPTYIVIDKSGSIRAAGVLPERVEAIVEKLLGETVDVAKANAAVAAANPIQISEADDARDSRPREIPARWLEGNREKRARLASLDTANPPALPTKGWMNSEPLTLGDLAGKVVVLDFWATWCGPCKKAVPKINGFHTKYGAHDVVVIGVCAERGADKLAETVQQLGISYPVCIDEGGAMAKACQVDGFPDYYVIDKAGTLRVVDCNAASVESAIRMLVAEPAPTRTASR